MSALGALDGDLTLALHDIGVPSYAIDSSGIIRWVNPAAERIVGEFGQLPLVHPGPAPEALPHLTPRQNEILRLLEHGKSTEQIAAELVLSPETVRNHVRRLLRALGAH